MKLIAYPLSGMMDHIRPAKVERDWMDALPQQYGYRCLPLNIANSHGWEAVCPTRIKMIWNGEPGMDAITIECDPPHHFAPLSHFGAGIVTFHVGALFRTPPGYNMFVTGPINRPKDGIAPLSGIIETDWSPYTFTMNWKFTTGNFEVVFEKGEPYMHFFPVPRDLIEEWEPEIHALDEDPVLAAHYRTWDKARNSFNADLKVEGSDAQQQGWQKGYFRGTNPDGSPAPKTHRTKLRVRPFPDWKP